MMLMTVRLGDGETIEREVHGVACEDCLRVYKGVVDLVITNPECPTAGPAPMPGPTAMGIGDLVRSWR